MIMGQVPELPALEEALPHVLDAPLHVGLLLQVSPTRGRVEGRITHYWRGHRLLSDEELERLEREDSQQMPGPLVYCRICKAMILEFEIVEQVHQHVQAPPSEPFSSSRARCGESRSR